MCWGRQLAQLATCRTETWWVSFCRRNSSYLGLMLCWKQRNCLRGSKRHFVDSDIRGVWSRDKTVWEALRTSVSAYIRKRKAKPQTTHEDDVNTDTQTTANSRERWHQAASGRGETRDRKKTRILVFKFYSLLRLRPKLSFFLSFFLILPSVYPLTVAVEGYCCSWPHTMKHIHSVGLLWKWDRPVAENSTWQHTTLTTDRHPCPGGIRTRNPSKRATAHPRLRPRGNRDQLLRN